MSLLILVQIIVLQTGGRRQSEREENLMRRKAFDSTVCKSSVFEASPNMACILYTRVNKNIGQHHGEGKLVVMIQNA